MERRKEGMQCGCRIKEMGEIYASWWNDTSEKIQVKKCNYYHVNKIQGYLCVTVSIFISSIVYFRNTAVSVIL